MASDLGSSAALLKGLEQVEWQRGPRKAPPVGEWNPHQTGTIDIRIARDGTWHYRDSPIGRVGLVRLFASILRRDDDGHFYLVTPIEKMRIRVDDAPFVAVTMDVENAGPGQSLRFRTNIGDEVVADRDHPIRVETDPDTGEPSPYILVRDRLEALIARSVFYDLVALAVEDGAGGLDVWSGGCAFPLGRVAERAASEVGG